MKKHSKNYISAAVICLASLGAFAQGGITMSVMPEVSGIEIYDDCSVKFTATVSIDPKIDQETQRPIGMYAWEVSCPGSYAPADIADGTKPLPVEQNAVTLFPEWAGDAVVTLTVSYMTQGGGMKTEEGSGAVEFFPPGGGE